MLSCAFTINRHCIYNTFSASIQKILCFYTTIYEIAQIPNLEHSCMSGVKPNYNFLIIINKLWKSV